MRSKPSRVVPCRPWPTSMRPARLVACRLFGEVFVGFSEVKGAQKADTSENGTGLLHTVTVTGIIFQYSPSKY